MQDLCPSQCWGSGSGSAFLGGSGSGSADFVDPDADPLTDIFNGFLVKF